jgi:hypothetical protein
MQRMAPTAGLDGTLAARLKFSTRVPDPGSGYIRSEFGYYTLTNRYRAASQYPVYVWSGDGLPEHADICGPAHIELPPESPHAGECGIVAYPSRGLIMILMTAPEQRTSWSGTPGRARELALALTRYADIAEAGPDRA